MLSNLSLPCPHLYNFFCTFRFHATSSAIYEELLENKGLQLSKLNGPFGWFLGTLNSYQPTPFL